MSTNIFDELIHRGLTTEEDIQEIDQTWFYIDHLLRGGDELTEQQKEDILINYQKLFSLLEDTEYELIQLDEENEGRKEIINDHFKIY